MSCDRCEAPAILQAAYSGAHLCEAHFCRSVEKRVRRRIRTDGLVPGWATSEDPATWVIGLSGGKDSSVLAYLLDETFQQDPRIEVVALTIHEGIDGYRDESVAACETLTTTLDIKHEIVSYAEEYDVRMDDIAADPDRSMAPCAYCGVFRRDVLERYARSLDADLLLTGHNLDDEAQTAMMNFLEGDVAQMAKHYRASLAPLSERDSDAPFIPRAKPLRDVPEREVALYAHVQDLPAHMTECPHASEAFRGTIQSLLHDLEDDHPGTRHSIMAGYERMAGELAAEVTDEQVDAMGKCEQCGAPTTDEVCRACQLVEQVSGSA